MPKMLVSEPRLVIHVELALSPDEEGARRTVLTRCPNH
jgi:hypothetical protein